MLPIDYHYISGNPLQDFNYDWIYDQKETLADVDPIQNPKTWNWFQHNWTPIDILLRHSIDPNTNEEIKYPIDYSERILREQRGFNNPVAFNAIRKYTTEVSRTLLIYTGKGKSENPINLGPGQVQAHLHTPQRTKDGLYKGPRMTATVIIPINIVEPVTETLCFSWKDVPYESMDLMKEVVGWENSLNLAEEYYDDTNVQRLRFPNEGEYLTLYFDSSHYLHWSELDTNNEFLCLVQDC